MLTKSLSIRNVGRFDFSVAAELAQVTVIYAENGRGKTTLAAVLRSLHTGSALHIHERRTIGSSDLPTAGFVARNGEQNKQCNFDGQGWNNSVGHIDIFDSAFIAANVYSGSEVDTDHRRNLHKFVLGASNVALANKVDELDNQVRAATQLITDSEAAVQNFCLEGFALEQFIKLPASPTVDADIGHQLKIVDAARAAKTITATQLFAKVQIPTFDSRNWDAALAISLAYVEQQAESRIRAHIDKHLNQGAERWLSEGSLLVKGDICPFCAASVVDNDLIGAYRSLFSAEYASLKDDIARVALESQNVLAKSVFHEIIQRFQTNSALAPAWKGYSVASPVAPDLDAADNAIMELSEAYKAAFASKSANLLEPMKVSKELVSAWSTIDQARQSLEAYNTAVEEANLQVSGVKSVAAANTMIDATRKLNELRNQSIRYQAVTITAIQSLIEARKSKKALEASKKKAREELDTETDALFLSYQKCINRHLANCGCGYSITEARTVYAGGKPRTDYQLVINSHSVDLTTPKTSGEPCFKNTLSDGDKSTLAFALFLAKLELDDKLREKIVVLDDPMTSLDSHRRKYTSQQITKLVPRCKQLILLTHDALFAREVWDELPKPKKALQILDKNEKSSVADWDIIRATQSEYFNRFEHIRDFVESGGADALIVAGALRPLLEGNLRMRFPVEFPVGEWLGDFIKKVREASDGNSLFSMQPSLSELSEINEYTKQFHHDPNPGSAIAKPVESELKAYSRRTLAFIRGLPTASNGQN
jgi:wobble nucleotide-excising tRNase